MMVILAFWSNVVDYVSCQKCSQDHLADRSYCLPAIQPQGYASSGIPRDSIKPLGSSPKNIFIGRAFMANIGIVSLSLNVPTAASKRQDMAYTWEIAVIRLAG
jgi:hypothetical protein